MDANAKSTLWHADTIDERGTQLEEFISENNLIILNKPNNYPTYMSTRGQSNIDVTLSTENFIHHIKSWSVDNSCKASNHNLIMVELGKCNSADENWGKDLGYNVKRGDW